MPSFKVSRTTQIESDPETVFRTLSDFSTWKTWSPWLLADEDATFTVNGNPTDIGGGFSWDGPIVGAGEMEHLELQPPSLSHSMGSMHAQLRFIRPWKSESKVDLQVKKGRNDDGREVTNVRWDMAGSLPFFLFWMKSMMVSLIGMDYDRGLRMLKELIESGEVSSHVTVNGISSCPPHHIVGLAAHTKLEGIGESMEQTFGDVKRRLTDAGLPTDGQWLSVYDDMNIKTQAVSYTGGMVISEDAPTPAGLIARSVPGFRAMHVTHTGRYNHLGNAWFAAYQNLQAGKHKVNKKMPGVEVYVNDPDGTSPGELLTEVYVPIK